MSKIVVKKTNEGNDTEVQTAARTRDDGVVKKGR